MIQTFIVEETKELIYDSDKIEEWKEKCNELGLEKQLALASQDKSPVPFEHMNNIAFRVYNVLCPQVVNYRNYNKTAIPLEVLSLIALAEKEKYFTEIQIWYDDKTPDPLAVGIIKKQDWEFDRYLIAKWGDVMLSFDELKAKARERYKITCTIDLKRKIAEATQNLAQVENNVDAFFDGQIENYNVVGF